MLPLCVYDEKGSFREIKHMKYMTSNGVFISGELYNQWAFSRFTKKIQF
jgi:hypothetical protein